MYRGYVKAWRAMSDHPIWRHGTSEQRSIVMALLWLASYKEKTWFWKGEKFIIKPGQMITSLESIAEKSGDGVTIQNVRTALAKFKKLEFLTEESTKQGRLITITNWELYQSGEDNANNQPNSYLTDDQQTTNRQPNTYQEDKEGKNKDSSSSKTQKKSIKKSDKIPSYPAWKLWIDCNREVGQSDPVPVGPDLGAGKTLGTMVTKNSITEQELKEIMLAYLKDQDRYLANSGHPLSLLPKRINTYRKQTSTAPLDAYAKEAEAEAKRIQGLL